MELQHDLKTLTMVFAYHVVGSVITADGETSSEEAVFLERRWPLAGMVDRGFILEDGSRTDKYRRARQRALADLPDLLSQADKLDLICTFMDAGLADGHLDRDEAAVITRAADLLGLTAAEWMDHLAKRDTMGEVELPEPEEQAGHVQLLHELPTASPDDIVTQTPSD